MRESPPIFAHLDIIVLKSRFVNSKFLHFISFFTQYFSYKYPFSQGGSKTPRTVYKKHAPMWARANAYLAVLIIEDFLQPWAPQYIREFLCSRV